MISPRPTRLIAAAAAAIAVVGYAFIPARRAAMVDPLVALRGE